MNKYWFRRKTFGLGATPTTWQGWLVIAVYCGLLVALARFLLGDGNETPVKIAVFFGVTLVLTAVMVWITWIKTEGGWGWTWGKRE